MGNIREVKQFDDIWNGEKAQKVREMVKKCPKNCWMVGTAAPVMKKKQYIKHPLNWVIKNKIRSIRGLDACIEPKWFDVGQNPKQGDLRNNM